MGWKTTYRIDQQTLMDWWNTGIPSPWSNLVLYKIGDLYLIGVDHTIGATRSTDFLPLPQVTTMFGTPKKRIVIKYQFRTGTLTQTPAYALLGECFYRESISLGSCKGIQYSTSVSNAVYEFTTVIEIEGKKYRRYENGELKYEMELADQPDSVKIMMYASYTPLSTTSTALAKPGEKAGLRNVEPYQIEFLIGIKEFEIQYYDYMEDLINSLMSMMMFMIPLVLMMVLLPRIARVGEEKEIKKEAVEKAR